MNILIIDDHDLFLEGMKLVLEKLGEACKVQTVTSGIEALTLIESNNDFDIVLLDYNLPNMSGIETLKNLKSSAPEIPVVMLSSEESPDRIQEAMKAGANGFITKNSSAEVTISAVKLVLSGGMYLPPQLLFNETHNTTDTQQSEQTQRTSTLPKHPTSNAQTTLTSRQKEVLEQMSNGFSNKQIAKHLNMSPSTVKVHVTAIFRELNVSNRIQAINTAKERGLIKA